MSDIPSMRVAVPIDIPTALTSSETFRLQEMASGKRVLEIGSLLGHSTIAMASVATRLHSVDPHEGYPVENPRPTLLAFIANLERYSVRHKVTIHVGRAQDVLPFMLPGIFEFAFIDVTGTYEDTAYCLNMAAEIVRRDGWIALHDMGRTEPDCSGATRAGQEFLAERGESSAFMVDTTMFYGPRRW